MIVSTMANRTRNNALFYSRHIHIQVQTEKIKADNIHRSQLHKTILTIKAIKRTLQEPIIVSYTYLVHTECFQQALENKTVIINLKIQTDPVV